MKKTTILLCACFALLTSCGDKDPSHDSGAHGEGEAAHEEHGPHGGELIEIGDHLAHIEVLHDDDAGKLNLFALDTDMKPIALDKAPFLNLMTDAGPKQLKATALGTLKSEWVFSDSALKSEPEGARLRIVLRGVTYTPELPHDEADH